MIFIMGWNFSAHFFQTSYMKFLLISLGVLLQVQGYCQNMDSVLLRNKMIKDFLGEMRINKIIYKSDVISFSPLTLENKLYRDSIIYQKDPKKYHRFSLNKQNPVSSLGVIYFDGVYKQRIGENEFSELKSIPKFINAPDFFYSKLFLVSTDNNCKASNSQKELCFFCQNEKSREVYTFNQNFDLIKITKEYENNPEMNIEHYLNEYDTFHGVRYPTKISSYSSFLHVYQTNIKIEFISQ